MMMTDLIGQRVPLLDKGYIELIDFMPHPVTGVSGDLAIVNAARVSFLGESKGDVADKKLLLYLMKHKHTSPFEMCVFKLKIHAPLVTFWQSSSNKQASLGQVDDDVNTALTEKLIQHYEAGYRLYEEALQQGVAREQARLFLPGFSAYYTCIWKVDAHNLMHFLKLRMADEAQYEIRVYAQAIYEHFFKVLLPWTAEGFEAFVLGDRE